MASKSRILFIYNTSMRFVKDDLQLLSEGYQVTAQYMRSIRNLSPSDIWLAVKHHDLVFGWFSSWHTVLPISFARLQSKPSVLVIGGYDTANLPVAGYGSQRGGIRQWVSQWGIRNATWLIVNSEAMREEAIRNARASVSKLTTVYHGIEPIPMGSIQRDALVLTVGNVWRENLLRKGLLPFVQSAAYLPELEFVLVGKWYDDSIEVLRQQAGSNVRLAGFVSDNELQHLYQTATIYVQASLHEGFGLSVAEAMSSGCIPVVTRNGSLPEVVGDAGVYADSNHPADLATAIRQALAQASSQQRQQARERILTRFPVENRRKALYQVVESLLDGKKTISDVIT